MDFVFMFCWWKCRMAVIFMTCRARSAFPQWVWPLAWSSSPPLHLLSGRKAHLIKTFIWFPILFCRCRRGWLAISLIDNACVFVSTCASEGSPRRSAQAGAVARCSTPSEETARGVWPACQVPGLTKQHVQVKRFFLMLCCPNLTDTSCTSHWLFSIIVVLLCFFVIGPSPQLVCRGNNWQPIRCC